MNKYRITYMRGPDVRCGDIEAESFDYDLVDKLIVYFNRIIDGKVTIVAIFNFVISIELLK